MALSPRHTFSAVLLCLALATVCLAGSITTELPDFDSISVCAPLNVLVVPSKDGGSRVVVEADQASSIRAAVAGSLLSIESTGSIKAGGDIKVTVSLPAAALQTLEVRSSSIYIAPGFTSQALTLTTGQLGGSIVASQLAAKQLSINAAGIAKVTVEGAFEEVSVDAQGASSVHIAGLGRKATLALSGVPNVAIAANNAGASIVGTSNGSRVLFNQGTCSVKGAVAQGTLCVQDPGLKLAAAPLRWTCKAAITGSNTCQTSGSSASTFSSTGGSDCATMTWKGAEKVARDKPTSSRRLRETSTLVSSVTSTTGSLPTSYTYTTTSTGANGEPSITACSFVNNKGGCQMDGVPVPVQQFDLPLPTLPSAPAPAPVPEGPLADQMIEGITAAANVATSIGTETVTSSGGTACVFVNGIGGCQTGG